MSDKRIGLIKLFWVNVRAMGMNGVDGKEIAYDVIDEKFPKAGRSIKNLSEDELLVVVQELCQRTGIGPQLHYDVPNKVYKKPSPAQERIVPESMTVDQLCLILGLAGKLEISPVDLSRMFKKFSKGVSIMTLRAAKNMIEGLKAMNKRGWKAKPREEEKAQGIADKDIENIVVELAKKMFARIPWAWWSDGNRSIN